MNLGEHYIKVKYLLLKNHPNYVLLNGKTIKEVIEQNLILNLDEDTTDELETIIKDNFELINSKGGNFVSIRNHKTFFNEKK